jgi:predicted metal-dependent phosphoesterase TrpH
LSTNGRFWPGHFDTGILTARVLLLPVFPNTMKQDFHMHTFLSDGEPSPAELVRACIDLKLDQISITDHDSVGSYPEALELAKGTSLRVVPGAELDCTYSDIEIHMLGLYLDFQNIPLVRHLKNIQATRKKRATEQAEAINLFYKRKVIDLDKIFARCQTFMNPHLIHAMMDQGLFDEHMPGDRYKQASVWMKENIRANTFVEKPTVEAMIQMIHSAGGIAVLAHPAYYFKSGHELNRMIRDLKEYGMDGIEVIYPYCQEGSREFPTIAHEREAVTAMQNLAISYGLQQTTGSDSHHLDQLRAFHTRS